MVKNYCSGIAWFFYTLDAATQEYEYQMKECHPPIITESEFRAVQEEKKKRSNIVTDNDGTHRSSNKYSSKKK